ncbi:MAG: AAA family ATPase [Myxococcales bacterium]
MGTVPGNRGVSLPPRSLPPARKGRVADRYVINAEIASGGMGAVLRVFDRQAGEERALKRIKPQVLDRPFFVEAFEREYQVLAGLDHPRIIRVFDYGVDEQGPYYTMELLQGEDMRKSAPVPYREACSYLRDVATSLALLHARRLIHRDLSPGNVRRTPDGHCKLFDFGALTGFGYTREIVGTPPAIPPEAVANAPQDHRSDLYQLGALAYWMLTNQHAYPANCIDDLPQVWQNAPPAPSDFVPGIPVELDLLVLSLLSEDPMARPASAAEVISRLEVIGGLAPEKEDDAELLAQSFLLNPRFTGRAELLKDLSEHATSARRGTGSAVLIEGAAGMGRTRFLEEVAVRAQIAGAHVVRVDASTTRHARGTVRAMAIRLLDAFPNLARDEARAYRTGLLALGREVEARLGPSASIPPGSAAISVPPMQPTGRSWPPPSMGGSWPPPPNGSWPPGARDSGEFHLALDGWFASIAKEKPLVLQVDNVEHADDASLGVLASLAKQSADNAIFLVFTETSGSDRQNRVGLQALRNQCARVTLAGLESRETLELVRSLFGDVPNVERFGEWLHGRTLGSPLHCMEITRQLAQRKVIRYSGGLWLLPVERPDAELPAALEDALLTRLEGLSSSARSLAECLSVQRERPTLELCRLLVFDAYSGVSQPEERSVHVLLDELARNDVLHGGEDGYHFSSAALREAVLAAISDQGRKRCHLRLGAAFSTMASDDPILQIEAGWHLIRGGDEMRGADMIALVASDSFRISTLIANLHHMGKPVEAALKVYKKHRCSIYQRACLLATMAQASYYEERRYGDLYGDEALDTLEHTCGLRLARLWSRFIGRHLALLFALSVACVRFYCVPKRERPYSFYSMLVQLFGTVTTLTASATLALDADRAARVAHTLKPFDVLPSFTTPVAIYHFTKGLQEIGRENQAEAYEAFDRLAKNFQLNPRFAWGLPENARLLYVAGCHFARGAFAVFREDGQAALESADIMDATGLKLYSMIASALRFLYYTNRGETEKALVHREQVEIHAAEVGSAWQVELWEAPALIPVYSLLGDVVSMARVRDRLEVSQKQADSLEFYQRLAFASLVLVRKGDLETTLDTLDDALRVRAPRSYIGWAALHGFLAQAYNERGKHSEALEHCVTVMARMTERDRDYVTMFLHVEMEHALALSGLGEHEQAMGEVDALIKRYSTSNHPLVQGGLQEVRAEIAWAAGIPEEYAFSLAKCEQWYRPTNTPALIAKCERLSELALSPRGRESRMAGDSTSTRMPRSRGKDQLVSGALAAASQTGSGPRSKMEQSERDAATVAVTRPPRKDG